MISPPVLMVIYGTRPEAIKMAPVIMALRSSSKIATRIVVTGQHADMVRQVNSYFGITPDHDLALFKHGQSLEELTSRTLMAVGELLKSEMPQGILVQGDTTTVFAAALAGFYAKVPVVHLEAGLRTHDPYSPFPEEMNRRLASQIADLHLAPTELSQKNLLRDGIRRESIAVTGNTVIDSLIFTASLNTAFRDARLREFVANSDRVVLITTHRRESWGEPMANTAGAVADLADAHPETSFVLPLHANPLVRSTVAPIVEGRKNVLVTEPLPYDEFSRLLGLAFLILTDSGGVQEEAPSLGKPVLVLRENTERPEAVSAGTVRLVGTSRSRIVHETNLLLTDHEAYEKMAQAVNPYGDGHAAPRVVAAIEDFYKLGPRLPDFSPFESDGAGSSRR